MKTKKWIAVFAAAAMLAASLSGCGNSSPASSGSGAYYREDSYPAAAESSYYGGSNHIAYEDSAMYEEDDYDEDYDSGESKPADVTASDQEGASGKNDVIDQTKIVYKANLRVESLEYDESKARIRAAITEVGGFIESESESDSSYGWYNENATSGTRTLYMTIRVPSASFDSFLTNMDGVGKVMSRSTNAENISKRYASTKTYIESLEIEQKRLLEMMDQAEDISDMIMVEERLTDVESSLNQYRTQLASMDTDVSYSTVDLQLTEVRRYTSTPIERKSFGTRLMETIVDAWGSFLNFMEGLLYLIIYLLPYAVLVAVIVLIVRAARKAWLKKHPEAANKPKRLSRKERKRLEEEARRQQFMARQPQAPAPQAPAPQDPQPAAEDKPEQP